MTPSSHPLAINFFKFGENALRVHCFVGPETSHIPQSLQVNYAVKSLMTNRTNVVVGI